MELKFRAWNGDEMITPDYVDRNGIAHWKEKDLPVSSDMVMMCTGFQEMIHGKDIYEGDIVMATMHETGAEWVGEIEFHRGAFMLKDRWLIHFDSFGIIGNIYEK